MFWENLKHKLKKIPPEFHNFLLGAAVLLFIFALSNWLMPDFANYIVVSIICLLAVIGIPAWLTRAPPQEKEPKDIVKQLLDDPFVRRNILRYEIGGVTAGVIALVFATYSVWQSNEQSRLAQDALRDQRISSAWQILSNDGPRATGKNYAFTVLLQDTNQPIIGLDLSCHPQNIREQRRNWQQFRNRNCTQPMRLGNTSLNRSDSTETTIRNSSFDFAEIERVEFERIYFTENQFESTYLRDVVFRDTEFWDNSFTGSEFSGVTFDHVGMVIADFTEGEYALKFVDSSVFYADFSNSRIDLSFENSLLQSARFVGLNLAANSIRGDPNPFVENSFEWPKVAYIDGAYGSDQVYDISRANFCNAAYAPNEEPPECWDLATQEFLKHAVFFKGQPPTGLELLSFDAEIRGPCPAQPELDQFELEAGFDQDIFSYLGHDCLELPLRKVSELLAEGILQLTPEERPVPRL